MLGQPFHLTGSYSRMVYARSWPPAHVTTWLAMGQTLVTVAPSPLRALALRLTLPLCSPGMRLGS